MLVVLHCVTLEVVRGCFKGGGLLLLVEDLRLHFVKPAITGQMVRERGGLGQVGWWWPWHHEEGVGHELGWWRLMMRGGSLHH
jgi:hypothetical protein